MARFTLGLTMKVGKGTDVWRDKEKIGETETFNEVIKRAVDNSAIFHVLTSPNSLGESDYVKLELETFFGKASNDDYGITVNTIESSVSCF